ncbi:MAG: LpqB family beta-propeller domain-containing protein, partial [Aquiluna sp.]
QLSSLIDVIALDYDKSGSLWAFPADASLSVEVYDQTTVVRTLASPFLGVRLAAAIAPEGTRIVQSIQTDDAESFLDVGVVLRDANSIPLSLNEGLRIQPVLGTPIAVSWQEMASIRVLETTASGLTAFSEYSVSGPRTQLPMPPTIGIELHAAASATSSYMLSEVGEVWLFSANSWRRIETGVTSISPLR